MLSSVEIKAGYVYQGEDGERRVVVSVSHVGSSPTVLWRTANPDLPKEAKAQGSCTVKSFARWPVQMQKATSEDMEAFEIVSRRREWARQDKRAVLNIRRTMGTAKT